MVNAETVHEGDEKAPERRLSEHELNKLDTRIEGLREQNLLMLQQIHNAGLGVDHAGARIEKFSEFLEEAGIITKEQRLREQEVWELHLRKSLQSMVQRVEQNARAQGAAVRRQSGLILPGG